MAESGLRPHLSKTFPGRWGGPDFGNATTKNRPDFFQVPELGGIGFLTSRPSPNIKFDCPHRRKQMDPARPPTLAGHAATTKVALLVARPPIPTPWRRDPSTHVLEPKGLENQHYNSP